MWAAALTDYEIARRGRPEDPVLRGKEAAMYAAWGDCLARDSQFELALERYACALRIKPDEVGVLARCVNAKIGLGDHPGALSDLERALTLAPREPGLIAQRAALLAASAQPAGGAG
jgi:tetratricopeptide (TPR) repeat protein